MTRRRFIAYNVIGGFVWVFGVTLAGYWLAEAIGEDIDKYLLPIIAVIIVLSLIPPFLEWRKAKKQPRHQVSQAEAEAEAAELHAIIDED
jgi:membrane-associated protein